MSTYSTDRRELLKIIGAIGATCAYPFASEELYGQHMGIAAVSPRFLNDKDFAVLSRITDLIIPETDTPGAIGAGVPDYVDTVIAQRQDFQLVVADGLRILDEQARKISRKVFIDLTEAQQLSILEPLCEAVDAKQLAGRDTQFFSLVKNLTADGYYTSRTGLLRELQYGGNKARSGFPDCAQEHATENR